MHRFWRALPFVFLLGVSGCIVPGAPGQDDLQNVDDPAVKLVDQLKDKPADLETHADLLRLQIQRGDVVGARGTVEHALFHCGKDFRAHMLAAQFHRWHMDLLTAEKSLLTARDLAPVQVEPRIALAALYRDAVLETQELEQRKIVVEIADSKLKAEFDLDFAYALSQAGQAKPAAAAAQRVIDAAGAGKARARAWILLSQLALDAGDEPAAINAALEARKSDPKERGPLRFIARLAGALKNPEPLLKSFDEALATQEDPEIRFAALFGAWTACTKLAVVAQKNPDGADAHAYWMRLRDLDPGQLDAVSRRYQVVSLLQNYTEETKALKALLEEQRVGVPSLPGSLVSLMRVWRAEDCLRLGAAHASLLELQQLEGRETGLGELRLLRATALFVARDDEACLRLVNQMIQESKSEPDELVAMRWQIALRQGKALELMRELEAQGEKTTNAALWTLAVTRFQVYRKGAAGGGK